MSLKADTKYSGKVAEGSQLYTTQTGTVGYQVMLETEDEQTSFTIWLTEKNRARASKAFETLGVDPENLKSQAYLEYQLGVDIVGKEVSFGTKAEEYNGRTTIKVAWIGKKSDPNLARGAASFFGGGGKGTGSSGPSEPSTKQEDPITDDDIPFMVDITWKERTKPASNAESTSLLTNFINIRRWVMGILESVWHAQNLMSNCVTSNA
ncbi:hypothetical protein EHM92_00150 [bacterium]|nr:MAG: hypothetical protein EHM92_00150 [bacterium]